MICPCATDNAEIERLNTENSEMAEDIDEFEALNKRLCDVVERMKTYIRDLIPYIEANADLLNENERQRAALAICVGALTVSATDHQKSARQFGLYVRSHLAKLPPDSEKAVTNNDHLVRCTDAAETALNAARDAAGVK